MDYELAIDGAGLLEGLKRFRDRRRIRPSEKAILGGYEVDIEDAERKLSRLITRVAKPLGSLGVTETDIRSLIERRLAERYTGRER
jgi:hypothetical protein